MYLPKVRPWLAGAASLLLASWAVSCAKDTGVGWSSGGSSGTGDSGVEGSVDGGGFPAGSLGSPCSVDSDCSSGQCKTLSTGKRVCAQSCVQGTPCPQGTYCAFDSSAGYICVLDRHKECAPCVKDSDCPDVGDRCAVTPVYMDHFCARDCSFDGSCPGGFTCVPVDSYDPGSSGDAGTSSQSSSDAGPQSMPPRMCVPDNNQSCPCSAQRDGVKRTCTQTSGGLTCGGTETCNGKTGQWEGCTAGTPKPEQCDGADDDCDGKVDDGTDQAMCQATTGTAAPPHGQWKCSAGTCVVGSCDPGYAAYPASLPPSAGCPCQVDSSEPNDTCATATSEGSVSDANASALNISGTLSSDTDVDWYTFQTVDSQEATTNSYHVKIVFTEPTDPTAAKQFVFDVIRGSQCATPDAKHSNLTSYDWCVDGTGTDASGNTIGEATCSATGPIHCGPHSSKYYVAVHRAAGATGTCVTYQLTITAKGTGNCDFSQATGTCDPQVNSTSSP